MADLSLRWVHTHFVGFVMSRLKCCFTKEFNMHSTDVDGVDHSVDPGQTAV